MGLKLEVLKRSGAWFYYGETRLGQGRDNVKQLFLDNPELANEVEEKIMERYNRALNIDLAKEKEEDAPAIMPVDTADIPARPRKRVDIDIAVDD